MNQRDDWAWKTQGYFYRPLGPAFREEFGFPVWKVSLDAKFTCPHKASGGCIFCDDYYFSPSRATGIETITEQLQLGIKLLKYRYKAERFIAYFQPSTNTFAPVEELERVYRTALTHPDVIGLAIGTRPDCLGEDVLDLLETLSRETWLSLELGLQTIHDSSLRFLNRGHDFACFTDAEERIRKRKLRLGVHLILGIEGEDERMRTETAERIARFEFHSLKLHNLSVVKNTKLAELWNRGEVTLPSLQEYARYVVDFLESQSPRTIIDRLSNDVEAEFLLAPEWSARRHSARNAIDREFRKRNTFQGSKWKERTIQ